jgi:hypothetical protein
MYAVNSPHMNRYQPMKPLLWPTVSASWSPAMTMYARVSQKRP